MPLEILAPVVVAGIVFTIVLVRVLVNTPPKRFASRDEALRAFGLDYPEERPGEAILTREGREALIAIPGNSARMGLVEGFGSKWVSRLLVPQDLRNFRQTGETGLSLELNDFTLPSVRLEFADLQAAAKARAWLDDFTARNMEP